MENRLIFDSMICERLCPKGHSFFVWNKENVLFLRNLFKLFTAEALSEGGFSIGGTL